MGVDGRLLPLHAGRGDALRPAADDQTVGQQRTGVRRPRIPPPHRALRGARRLAARRGAVPRPHGAALAAGAAPVRRAPGHRFGRGRRPHLDRRGAPTALGGRRRDAGGIAEEGPRHAHPPRTERRTRLRAVPASDTHTGPTELPRYDPQPLRRRTPHRAAARHHRFGQDRALHPPDRRGARPRRRRAAARARNRHHGAAHRAARTHLRQPRDSLPLEAHARAPHRKLPAPDALRRPARCWAAPPPRSKATPTH